MTKSRLMWGGLTAVFIAYFLPWQPHEAAGLRLIGWEIGEWVKFLPQVQSGEVGINRDWFYLPPVTLGLCLILLTANWSNWRWQTWVQRGLGVGLSLLAVPAWEVIRGEPSHQWRPRLIAIGVVMLMGVIVMTGRRWPDWLGRSMLLVTAIVGTILPVWAYWGVRPAVSYWLQTDIGVGSGVWLHLVGFIVVIITVIVSWRDQKDDAGASSFAKSP
ncbi:MAG TPA: hypothetical protein VLL52_02995 [Anaerolineae bacterium]|nr:hypothetical protein [Anaerolineae bacterium]